MYLWKLRPYWRQVMGSLIVGTVLAIIMNTATVLPAIMLGRAIDAVLRYSKGTATSGDVAWAAAWVVLGTLATEGPRVPKRRNLMTVTNRMRASIRADALRGVLAWPADKLASMPVGGLMARIVGDADTLYTALQQFDTETWDAGLYCVSIVVAMCFYDWRLTLLVMAPVPFAMILARYAGTWVRGRTTRARQANADLTAALQESLIGLRVVRLFGRAAAVVQRVNLLSRRQADANVSVARLNSSLQPFYGVLMTAGVVIMVWQGGLRVIGGAWTVGAFVAYLDLFRRFLVKAFNVPQLVNNIQSGGAAYARLEPLLAPPFSMAGEPKHSSFNIRHIVGLKEQIPPRPKAPEGPVAVEVEHVSFKYPASKALVLDDVSLRIPAGSLVAVTGPIGSGKSALARTLLGLYPLESGRVLLDGRPIQDIPRAERTARTGYLPQDAYLFSGSVRDNVEFFAPPPGGNAETPSPAILEALRLAGMSEDLRSLPKGTATEIGEMGVRVSGGQKQRIALARTLAAWAPAIPGLLVLDDPFSAVDVETEAKIISGFREAFGPTAPPEHRATIVLCSHRLAVCPQADLVVVLDGGRIVEQGSHEKLLASGGLYARIFRAQSLVSRVTTKEAES